MPELTELSDAEHLVEYARQMVRCDAESEDIDDRAANFVDVDEYSYAEVQIDAEMDKLTEMVAGLTASQATETEG